ncbi:hypothetical protein [Caenispirillum salinarum]|uniref:hypothetical protein n=1 Tax=Caenispirillum salinarum TaxID=859058 RepID=UPI00384A75D1
MEERRDQSVSAARDEAKQRASSAADDARRVAAEQGDAWRHSLLSTVDHVAEAMDAAASRLREDEPRLAGAVEDLSRHVKRFAGDGHNKSFDELRGDLENVARSNPTLFMAGAMALGLGLSRVLKSTPPEHREGSASGHSAGAGTAPPPATSRHTTTPPRPGASTTPAGQPDRPSAASGTSAPPSPSPSPSPSQSPAAVPGSAAPNTGRSI